MKGAEIREAFLKFFESKGHRIVASSSLVPHNDPTLLFSNAGMNQFKDLFLGAEKRDYTRATTAQKCLRISGKHNDLENVGVTARHHTFFEMLGNFSFGDYFKKEVIPFAWEFITEVLKLDKERLWVTVFEQDDEAATLWHDLTGIQKERIVRLGEKDNFWAMGDTGPCGPCSEIHYYLGDNPQAQTEDDLKRDDGSFLEIWNLVFMQFNRSADGTMPPLPRPSVDTGMGLERVAAIMQGVKANYDCDLLRDIITRCEELSGYKYDGSSYLERDLKTDIPYARDVAMRVIADHSRAIAFLIADGVQPAADGRGYVLRRLIRRAVRHGRVLGFKEPFLIETTATVVKTMGGHFPELNEQRELIFRLVQAEERKFQETLESGLNLLQKEVEKLHEDELFSGKTAFLLHDTFGFPLDLTEDVLKAYSKRVDLPAFEKAMAEQKARSREDRKAQDIVFQTINVTAAPSQFCGYEVSESTSKITQVILNAGADLAKAGDRVSLLFDKTPFYAECGGQIGDSGTIVFGDTTLRVLDTQKVQEVHHLHICEVVSGEVSAKDVGSIASLKIDTERRARIAAHHSATHLLHAALRKVLGDHVKQSGSKVSEKTLRFDYSHFEQPTAAQLKEVQEIVNAQIRKNVTVSTDIMSLADAQKSGAIAFFGEKYGSEVRVVSMDGYSKELCGGTHVKQTGDIGLIIIASDGGISAGVRRIECLAGAAALEEVLSERSVRDALVEKLKTEPDQLVTKIDSILNQTKDLEREIELLKSKLAGSVVGDLESQVKSSASGVKVLTAIVEAPDVTTLRTMVDRLRLKIVSGVVALAAEQNGAAVLVVGVTPDLTERVSAGTLVKEAAKVSGGKGGGRADFAQAGGLAPDQIQKALDKVFHLIA
ncbi:MAG: alanine--tRNA ligase [Bdellovibrionota bacterium]|jgi:alanyl-tRNA synthetase